MIGGKREHRSYEESERRLSGERKREREREREGGEKYGKRETIERVRWERKETTEGEGLDRKRKKQKMRVRAQARKSDAAINLSKVFI